MNIFKENIKINKNIENDDMKALLRIVKLEEKFETYGYDYKLSHTDIDDLQFIFYRYILMTRRLKNGK